VRIITIKALPQVAARTLLLEITGNARTVFARGEIIVEYGEFRGRAGQGRFLKRPPGSATRYLRCVRASLL
jgi:hypothetical protein